MEQKRKVERDIEREYEKERGIENEMESEKKEINTHNFGGKHQRTIIRGRVGLTLKLYELLSP